jgi:hypothetical protein
MVGRRQAAGGGGGLILGDRQIKPKGMLGLLLFPNRNLI